MNSLIKIGWNTFFQNSVSEEEFSEFSVARVTEEQRSEFHIRNELGEFSAVISGKFRFKTVKSIDFPTVGDWVLVRSATVKDLVSGNHAIIDKVLPRKSLLTRKSVDGHRASSVSSGSQPIAANIDIVFLMTSLNQEFNPRRLERYITMILNSKAIPVVILSKADLCSEIQGYISMVYQTFHNVEIHIISSISGQGIEELQGYFTFGTTSAIVGSSGVGKSTLINTLMQNNKIAVKSIREDGKGRHTTSTKSMHFLPTGGIIIDTPGIRGLQVSEDTSGSISAVFDDVEKIIMQCKFKNCQHNNEPGCAINSALQDGTLDEGRYKSYLKLQKEIRFFERRKKHRAFVQRKKDMKKEIAKRNKKMRRQKW